jgi:regulator of CtrA degradation
MVALLTPWGTFVQNRMTRRMMIQPRAFNDNEAISFGQKLARSAQFMALFDEGMDLVAAAADYLDGDGRAEAKMLPREAALGYAIESVRLTTRLVQVSSWLLLQRAVNQGELSQSEATVERRRLRLTAPDDLSHEAVRTLLPIQLCGLIEMSLRLQARVIHLDDLLYRSSGRGRRHFVQSPVRRQLDQLRSAFGAHEAIPR